MYTPEKVCQIVLACAVLHNVAQLKNVPLPPDADCCVGPDPDPHPQTFEPNAAAVRQRLEVMLVKNNKRCGKNILFIQEFPHCAVYFI